MGNFEAHVPSYRAPDPRPGTLGSGVLIISVAMSPNGPSFRLIDQGTTAADLPLAPGLAAGHQGEVLDLIGPN